MMKRCMFAIVLFAASALSAASAQAQTPNDNSSVHIANLASQTAFRFAFAPPRVPGSRGFSLSNRPAGIALRNSEPRSSPANFLLMTAGANLQVVGSGTIGRLTKWTGITSSNSFIGDSTIFESKTGLVGVGTDSPTAKLTVAGMIESTTGGFKFPDGTVQTTSAAGALFTVFHDATLIGNGTTAAPLGGAVPLVLSGSVNGADAIISATTISNGFGIKGASSGGSGVFGVSSDGFGVQGSSTNGHGVGGFSSQGIGVRGSSGQGIGVAGLTGGAMLPSEAAGVSGAAVNEIGVFGRSDTGNGVQGLSSGGVGVFAQSLDGEGLIGSSVNGIGVLATSVSANNGAVEASGFLAGRFSGNVVVAGALSATTKMFKIDHPLDPANKYLLHTSVESSEMMNIYNGNTTLDQNGEAIVQLPDWFQALNRDFRYQLTCIGGFAPIYIAEKIAGNRFKIAGGQPGVEVSWQVTGIRHDPYANKYRMKVEEEKPEGERGYYLHPEVFNQADEKNIEWTRHPELMRQMKERRAQLKQLKENSNH